MNLYLGCTAFTKSDYKRYPPIFQQIISVLSFALIDWFCLISLNCSGNKSTVESDYPLGLNFFFSVFMGTSSVLLERKFRLRIIMKVAK